MYQNYNDISYAESPFGTLNQYMTKTFGWMFAGLLVTFAVAIGAISTGLVYAFINSGVFFITCIAELILVGVLSARVTSLQPGTATGIFFAYAALNGLNLCSIFLIYDLGSLVLAFLVGAVYFGVMAVYGATTNRSLVGWGPKLMGGLIAMIICSLVGSLFSLFGFSSGAGRALRGAGRPRLQPGYQDDQGGIPGLSARCGPGGRSGGGRPPRLYGRRGAERHGDRDPRPDLHQDDGIPGPACGAPCH